MTGFELMHVSNVACSLVTFLLNVVLNLAAWLIVLTTVDRFVAVWLPLHAAAFCRRRRARFAILTLVAVVVLASVHLFWTTGLHHSSGRAMPYCGPAPDARFMRYQFEYIKLTSYCLAPFAIIFSLNVAIVVRLHCGKVASVMQRGSDNGGSGLQQAVVTSRVTYMLLAVSATWLILSAPFTLQTLLGNTLLDVRDDRSVARYRLLRTLCFQLMYANHAVNFFLYCVTGRKFRHELSDMFVELCCCCCGRVADDRRCCAARHLAGATGDRRNRSANDGGTLRSTTWRQQTGHELALVTTRPSVAAAQSNTTGRCADTSL